MVIEYLSKSGLKCFSHYDYVLKKYKGYTAYVYWEDLDEIECTTCVFSTKFLSRPTKIEFNEEKKRQFNEAVKIREICYL